MIKCAREAVDEMWFIGIGTAGSTILRLHFISVVRPPF